MNAPLVSIDRFKEILADGDSNDSEITALQEALDAAGDIIFTGQSLDELNEKLHEILIDNGYEP